MPISLYTTTSLLLPTSRSPSPLLVTLRDDPNASWIHNCKYTVYVFMNFTIAWRWHNCGIKPTLKLSPISVQKVSQSVCLYGTRVKTYFCVPWKRLQQDLFVRQIFPVRHRHLEQRWRVISQRNKQASSWGGPHYIWWIVPKLHPFPSSSRLELPEGKWASFFSV